MISLLAAAAILGQEIDGVWFSIGTGPDSPDNRLRYYIPNDRLKTDKNSPMKFKNAEGEMVPYKFPFLIAGYGRLGPNDPQFNMKFRIFSQDRKTHEELSPKVVRMLLQIWDLNMRRLQIDHSKAFNGQIVDVYLCWGGTPGGEQRFDYDTDGGRETRVNTIYIYDLPSFKDPVEMAREVAHEYGHATLPPIGGFKSPEDWANGYLGEKLYLKWLRDELKANKIGTDDTMGTTLPVLNDWVRKNVDPLIKQAVENGPRPSLMKGTGPNAMDATNGLILYMSELMPYDILFQSLKNFGGDVTAGGYLNALRDAVVNAERVPLRIDAKWKNIAFWVPTGPTGKLLNGNIVRRDGDWALIRPGLTGVCTIDNAAKK